MSYETTDFNLLIEKKSQFSKKIDIPMSAHQLEVDYDNNPEQTEEINNEIRGFVEANLAVVYQFLDELFSDEQIFTRSWIIKFSKSGNFRAQGKIMVIPIEKISNAIQDKDKKQLQIILSQIAHETIHNLTDSEALPMLMELIFLIESNSEERLSDIRDLYVEEKLPTQYVVGIKTICKWLDLDIDIFFEKIINNDIDINKLKELLKKQVKIEAQHE